MHFRIYRSIRFILRMSPPRFEPVCRFEAKLKVQKWNVEISISLFRFHLASVYESLMFCM